MPHFLLSALVWVALGPAAFVAITCKGWAVERSADLESTRATRVHLGLLLVVSAVISAGGVLLFPMYFSD